MTELINPGNVNTTEQKYIFLELINEGITLSDETGHFIVFNKKMEQLTGYSKEEANASPDFSQLIYPDQALRKKALDGLNSLLKFGDEFETETTIQTKEGMQKNALVSTKLIRDQDHTWFLSVYHDISQRKKIEKLLQENTALYETLVNTSPEAISVFDLEGHFTFISPQTLKLHGYEQKEELLGHNAFELIAPEDRERSMGLLQKALQGEPLHNIEYIALKKNGARFILGGGATAIKDAEGKPKAFISVTRDITEQKKVEETLRTARDRYLSTIELTGLLGWTTNALGEVIEDIPTWRKFTGQSEEDMKGTGWSKALHPDDVKHAVDAWKKAVETKSLFEIEYRIRRYDGIYRHFLVHGAPLLNMDGSIREWVGACIDITERKQMEDTLLLNERKFRELADFLPETVFEVDLEGHITFVNQIAFSIFQYTKEDIKKGLNIFETIIPQEREIAKEKLGKIIQSQSQTGNEYRMLRKDGSTFPALIYTNLILSNGKPTGLRGLLIDITERKKIENILKENEEKYRNVVERANDGITIIQDGVVQYINTRLAEMWGGSVEDIIGKNFIDYVHPDDRLKVVDHYKRVMAGEKISSTYEAVLRRKDGRKLYADLNTGLTLFKGKPADLVFIRDITERKKMEDKLGESANKYKELIERSLDGYILIDMDDKIIEYNTVFKKMSGYSDEELLLLKKTWKDITPKELHARYDAIRNEQVLKRGYSDLYETEIVGKDGRIIPVELRRHLIKENGTPIGMWCFIRDITDRKRSEEELTKKMKALERYKNVTVGRELQLIKLKKQVKELEQKLDKGNEP